MIVTRRAFTAALSLTGVAALVGPSPFHLMSDVLANGTADNVADPVSLPEMALGSADAAVTITEYASITCPHCAAFNENVFPKIKAAYIDTAKIRYVFREFPLDPGSLKCVVALHRQWRCRKILRCHRRAVQQEWSKVTKPRETLNQIGKQAGLDEEQVGTCLKDEALFNKIVADRAYATAKLGVNSTPTFLINGDKIVGNTPFEEFDRRIKELLKI